jgi:hypothetical protein
MRKQAFTLVSAVYYIENLQATVTLIIVESAMSASVRPAHGGPIVFVIQADPKKNMVSAQDWGDLVLLLDDYDEPTLFNIPQITKKIFDRLIWMKSSDYLLLTGSPIAMAIAAAAAARLTLGNFNVLKWDNQERRYWEAQVNFHNLPEE